MGEQGEQERAENAPLLVPSVDDQRGERCCFLPSTPGAACQKVQDPVAQGRVETQVLSLMMSLEGTMVLTAKL